MNKHDGRLFFLIYGALDVCSASDLDYWDYDLYDVIPEHKKYVITRLNRFRNLNGTLQNLYLNDISDAKNPMASPLYATDFSNLSNVLMIEAEYDYFICFAISRIQSFVCSQYPSLS